MVIVSLFCASHACGLRKHAQRVRLRVESVSLQRNVVVGRLLQASEQTRMK